LEPWNVGYCGDDQYFDKMLVPGVRRPATALILDPEERRRYREQRGFKT
jgi:hypothetical protein